MNPKVSEFLTKYPEATLLSFGWALAWRLYLVILGAAFVIGFVGGLY